MMMSKDQGPACCAARGQLWFLPNTAKDVECVGRTETQNDGLLWFGVK